MIIENDVIFKAFMDFITLKDRRLLIAIDFDGTLVEPSWPKCEIGNLKKLYITDWINKQYNENLQIPIYIFCLDIIKEWQSRGNQFILWTCRHKDLYEGSYDALQDAVDFCKENGFTPNHVNENHHKIIGPRKVMADRYIDDLATDVLKWQSWNMNSWNIPNGFLLENIENNC